jgi:hypothetical protein
VRADRFVTSLYVRPLFGGFFFSMLTVPPALGPWTSLNEKGLGDVQLSTIGKCVIQLERALKQRWDDMNFWYDAYYELLPLALIAGVDASRLLRNHASYGPRRQI